MRITINLEDSSVTSGETSVKSDRTSRGAVRVASRREDNRVPIAVNGGTPSESLHQLISADTSKLPPISNSMNNGVDAGSPPQWLHEAIQGATASATVAMNPGSDGGIAPN